MGHGPLADHRPRPTGFQRSTAHLIESQTFFSMVNGEKSDNQNTKKVLRRGRGLF